MGDASGCNIWALNCSYELGPFLAVEGHLEMLCVLSVEEMLSFTVYEGCVFESFSASILNF